MKLDLELMVDWMEVEAGNPMRGQGAALYFCFDRQTRSQPLGIRVEGMTAEQASRIAKAVNAILDGHAVTIHDNAECDDVVAAASVLLHALDSGILAYKADKPESAYVSGLRNALREHNAEARKRHEDREQAYREGRL